MHAISANRRNNFKLPHYIYVKHPDFKEGYALPADTNQEIFDSAINFQPDPGDIFIASYPKSGTTWLSNIIYLMKNNGIPLSSGTCISDVVPFLEFEGGEATANFSKPRLVKTHLYYELTPYNPDVKYVFVARNPKDVAVSFFYHTVEFDSYHYEDGAFDDFFEMFLSGGFEFGDYFKLVPEWFRKSKEKDNIHFMLYEDMKNDTKSEIVKLADFLGDPWRKAIAQTDEVLLKKVIQYSSFKKMHKDSKDGVFCPMSRPATLPFVLKGIIGDWKTHFTSEQSIRMDKKLEEVACIYPEFSQLWSKYKSLLSF